MREDLIERLRREADISARPGQMDRLNAIADEFAAAPDTIRALLDERDALREALAALITWIPSADTYRRLGFDPEAPMRALGEARAALAGPTTNEGQASAA